MNWGVAALCVGLFFAGGVIGFALCAMLVLAGERARAEDPPTFQN